MSDRRPETDDDDRRRADDEPCAALVKRALEPPRAPRDAPDLLGGVQRRIRKRSRGKFFADGWSTDAGAHRATCSSASSRCSSWSLAYFVARPDRRR